MQIANALSDLTNATCVSHEKCISHSLTQSGCMDISIQNTVLVEFTQEKLSACLNAAEELGDPIAAEIETIGKLGLKVLVPYPSAVKYLNAIRYLAEQNAQEQ